MFAYLAIVPWSFASVLVAIQKIMVYVAPKNICSLAIVILADASIHR